MSEFQNRKNQIVTIVCLSSIGYRCKPLISKSAFKLGTWESKSFELWPINSEELTDPASRSIYSKYQKTLWSHFLIVRFSLGSREDYQSSKIFDIFILYILTGQKEKFRLRILFCVDTIGYVGYKIAQTRPSRTCKSISKPVVINFRQLIDSKLSIRLT